MIFHLGFGILDFGLTFPDLGREKNLQLALHDSSAPKTRTRDVDLISERDHPQSKIENPKSQIPNPKWHLIRG